MMGRRDARLNRSRSQIRGELPDRAPLDHIERMFDPGTDRRVCRHFPGCLCGDDCIDMRAESELPSCIFTGAMIAVALIGAGLLFAGLR